MKSVILCCKTRGPHIWDRIHQSLRFRICPLYIILSGTFLHFCADLVSTTSSPRSALHFGHLSSITIIYQNMDDIVESFLIWRQNTGSMSLEIASLSDLGVSIVCMYVNQKTKCILFWEKDFDQMWQIFRRVTRLLVLIHSNLMCQF